MIFFCGASDGAERIGRPSILRPGKSSSNKRSARQKKTTKGSPSLVGWRPSLLCWRPSLLGSFYKPSNPGNTPRREKRHTETTQNRLTHSVDRKKGLMDHIDEVPRFFSRCARRKRRRSSFFPTANQVNVEIFVSESRIQTK